MAFFGVFACILGHEVGIFSLSLARCCALLLQRGNPIVLNLLLYFFITFPRSHVRSTRLFGSWCALNLRCAEKRPGHGSIERPPKGSHGSTGQHGVSKRTTGMRCHGVFSVLEACRERRNGSL